MRSVFKIYIKSGPSAGFRLCRFGSRFDAEGYAAKCNREHAEDLYGVTELTTGDNDLESRQIIEEIRDEFFRESWSNPAPDVFRDPSDAPEIPGDYLEDFELAATELAYYVCKNHNFPTIYRVLQSLWPEPRGLQMDLFAHYCVGQSLGHGVAWSDSLDGAIQIDGYTVEPPVYDDPEYADRQSD